MHIEFLNEDPVEIREANIEHERAFEGIVKALNERGMLDGIAAVGHRMVHGGRYRLYNYRQQCCS